MPSLLVIPEAYGLAFARKVSSREANVASSKGHLFFMILVINATFSRLTPLKTWHSQPHIAQQNTTLKWNMVINIQTSALSMPISKKVDGIAEVLLQNSGMLVDDYRTMIITRSIGKGVLAWCLLGRLACHCAALQVFDLKCDYQTDPLGIDALKPGLSWKLDSASAANVRPLTKSSRPPRWPN